ADAKAEVSERSMARLELLESALRLHEVHGDMSCPVCHTGELDDDWRRLSAESIAQQRQEYEDVRRARQSLAVALSTARRLLTPGPANLSTAPAPELADAVAQAKQMWAAWAKAPEGNDAAAAQALADHLGTHEDLSTALELLRSAAKERLDELDAKWQP